MEQIKPFKYFPHTESDIKEMLDKIGVEKIEDLFSDIPNEIKKDEVDLESALSEDELRDRIHSYSKLNKNLICFKGCGSYDVFTPSVINTLVSRQEFLTSYTPYQAEISQGTLQYIFEFQSVVCELTGMDVANASMYDGATATAEAIMMALSQTRRSKVLVSKALNPRVLEVIKTYAHFKGYELVLVNEKDLVTDKEDLLSKLDPNTAAVVLGYPNYYGYIEDFDFVDKLKENKTLLILNSDISCFSVLATPAELGASIVAGDAQALGISKDFGGPYVGYIACTNDLLRKIPGRIVGMTNDKDGNRGYVLTLQAREQHIRREKATSNICSNQSLMALIVTIYVATLGKAGLIETQEMCYENSHYLESELLKTGLFEKVSNNEFIKEFTLKTKLDMDKVNKALEENQMLGGEVLGDKVIFCATETKNKELIDKFVDVIKKQGGKN